MTISMTAFARHQASLDQTQLNWELRSVNHRFLEVSFRLPESLRGVEHKLKELARKKLKRGKVDCSLKLDTAAASQHLELNRENLLPLIATIEQIRRDAPELGAPNPMDILKWPGILVESSQTDLPAIEAAACASFSKALDDLVAHRSREGEQLAAIITERLEGVSSFAIEARQLASNLTLELKDRLLTRIADLDTNLSEERLTQEVVLLVQRADVREELDRLEIHVKEAHATLASSEPQGRRLDFISQELNREANTLGAKAVMGEVSKLAVDLKISIEQIREQVQNIE